MREREGKEERERELYGWALSASTMLRSTGPTTDGVFKNLFKVAIGCKKRFKKK